MATHTRRVVHLLLLVSFAVQEVRLVCVDVASENEAIVGRAIKLTCIYCMKREEINAETKVKWFYTGPDNRTALIYVYDRERKEEQKKVDSQWKGRVLWNGSKDMQDISISIQNVTLNDTGKYECNVTRLFDFEAFKHSENKSIKINLEVKTQASENTTALYSEIMMYVLLVFLTFWLLVEMIYCYRKISKSEEQAQDTATDYLAIPSENKETPGPAVTE